MKQLIYAALLTCITIPASYAGTINTANTTPASKAATVNPDLAIINAFYTLLSNQDVDAAVLKTHAAPTVDLNWNASPTPLGGQGLDGFAQTFASYHQAIPNMKWTPKSIRRSGHTYTVRSIGSGTPVFDFLGIGAEWVPGNSFSIMTIDIHTVRDGKIVRTFHVEDWREAMRQLKIVK